MERKRLSKGLNYNFSTRNFLQQNPIQNSTSDNTHAIVRVLVLPKVTINRRFLAFDLNLAFKFSI